MDKYKEGTKVVYIGKLKTYKGRIATIAGRVPFKTETQERYYIWYDTGRNRTYPPIVTLKEIRKATKAEIDKLNKRKRK